VGEPYAEAGLSYDILEKVRVSGSKFPTGHDWEDSNVMRWAERDLGGSTGPGEGRTFELTT